MHFSRSCLLVAMSVAIALVPLSSVAAPVKKAAPDPKPTAAGDDAPTPGDAPKPADTKPAEEDKRSPARKRHEARVNAAETVLHLHWRAHEAGGAVPDEKANAACKTAFRTVNAAIVSPDEYATCDETNCKLHAVGHARVLADWSAFSSELDRLPAAVDKAAKACAAPGVNKVNKNNLAGAASIASMLGLGGGLASAASATATATLESLRKWSEAAIKRRMKREAIVALVHRLDREFCQTDDATKAVLPRTCALASDEALDHVSAGGAQLEVIRSAIVGDLRELPARGFVTDDGVISDAKLEDARETLVEGLQRGESPAILLPEFGEALVSHMGAKRLACHLELSTTALGYADPLGGLSDEEAVSAAYLAATMVADKDLCKDFVAGAGSVPDVVSSWQTTYTNLEALAGPWRVAKSAAKAYETSAEAIALGGGTGEADDGGAAKQGAETTSGDKVAVDVEVNVAGDEKAGKKDADETQTKDKAESGADKPAQERAAAARKHAHTSVRFARVLTALVEARVRLGSRSLSETGKETTNTDADVTKSLRALRTRIDLTELTVVGDWGALVAAAAKPPKTPSTEKEKTVAAATKAEDSEPTDEAQRKALQRLSGILTAVATEQDSDALLTAVAAAAMPAASWRTKLRPGAFTVSLGAHVGITTAAELRFGTYGATYYEGQAAYVAPTLFTPVGLDLSWARHATKRDEGSDAWKKRLAAGLFFPLVDPAAFLQYDIHNGGRLPGPRVTTIFAPGVAGRLGIGDTALSVLAYVIFRPQLRTWDPTVSDPGASVVQFGGSVSWDIPLVILRSKKRGS